jgi:hypothetical protein
VKVQTRESPVILSFDVVAREDHHLRRDGRISNKGKPMAQATLKNQQTIISNQKQILRNQDRLKMLLRNQDKIVRNQQAIIKNQKKILANQGRILARARILAVK